MVATAKHCLCGHVLVCVLRAESAFEQYVLRTESVFKTCVSDGVNLNSKRGVFTSFISFLPFTVDLFYISNHFNLRQIDAIQVLFHSSQIISKFISIHFKSFPVISVHFVNI